MDYLQNIVFTEDTVSAEITYPGTPQQGMLAWLDGKLLAEWWKADVANIEPAKGGMFYISWKEQEIGSEHAVLGVVSKIDTETNTITVSRILYLCPQARFTNIHMRLEFRAINERESKMLMLQTFNFSGTILQQYHDDVINAWPKTLSLFFQHRCRDRG